MEILTFIVFLLKSSTDRVFGLLQIHVAGMEMTAGAILNLGVLGLAALLTLRRAGSGSFPFRVWTPFILAAGASVGWSSDKSEGVRLFLALLTYVSFFAMPFLVRPVFRYSAHLLKGIIYSSIVPAAIGILELIFFRDPSGRVQSTFSHPNSFAFYLMIVLGVIFFLQSSSAVQFTPFMRKLMVPYSGLLLGLLIMTQTRAAWAGTLIILATYAIFVNRRYLLALPLLPLLLFIPAVGDRLADLQHGAEYTGAMGSRADELNSFAWRELMWKSALADVADTPVFGKGLASFAPNSLKFFPLAANTQKTFYRGGWGAHNTYVQAFYETGAVGLFCYLMIFIGLFSRVLRYLKADPRGAMMVASTILAYMAANFSDNIFYYGSLNWYFWGFLGIVFAKWAQRQSELSFSFSRLASRSRLAYRYGEADLKPSA
ncbi:MAG TPA: O-antigen ligase family protein [Lacipirellulaceae bacterium]|nr:O-antigen ligase family protein [Lacipirellulaceae bacterium]